MKDELDITVDRKTLPMQVASEIEKLIEEQELKPGNRLPSERELANQLRVGRPVIREAIKILNSRGLVTIRPGSGTYIKELKAEVLSDSLLRCIRFLDMKKPVEKIRELRIMLEPQIASLAALRAGARDIRMLEDIVIEMEESLGDPERYIQADIDFHLALARASKNEMFLMLLEPITDLLREYMGNFVKKKEIDLKRMIDTHKQILSAVRKGDRKKAEKAISDHLSPGYDETGIK